MEKVLITGVTGFIGSEIAKNLVREGQYEISGLARNTSNKNALKPIEGILNNIDLRFGNFVDYHTMRKIIKDISPQYIIHIGARTEVRDSFDQSLEFQETNYLGTINIIHAAKELSSFKKFIFASTMETYGWQTQRKPFKEDLKQNPASPYAVSKVACEEYIRMENNVSGFPFIISRACNTYGRKHNTGFITEYIVTSMLQDKTVYLGTPNAIRDMMYVDDHVNAYLTTLKSPVTNEIFNFGTGSMTRMIEIAEKVKKKVNFKGKIVPHFPPGYPYRPVIEEFLSLDSSKAKEMLGWEPKYSLDEGLEKIISYWKEKLS
jgi:nucleoside-diphosphate-sugar epimerase